jgi:hypothetical protein
MTMTQTQEQGTGRLPGFEVRAIDEAVLSQLRHVDDAGQAPRVVINSAGAPPLRCCLRSAEPGERIALVSYAPLRRWAAATGADPGPYDEVGPVFIHPEPCDGPAGEEYPVNLLRSRRVFRSYRADGSIIGGRLVEPAEVEDQAGVEQVLAEVFADPEVALVHVRAADVGCFTFEVSRSGAGRPSGGGSG